MFRGVIGKVQKPIFQQSIAGIAVLKPPPNYQWVEFPPERRKLKILDKVPNLIVGKRIPKSHKRLIDIRGPELVHNQLIHKQYGIRALHGGYIKHGHIEMMRNGINRRMDDKRMFAVWRIDAPWKPVTKKGTGHRMGGGKGAINHYVTPVKGGRIIIELGGHVEFDEVKYMLKIIAQKLPMKAEIVTHQLLLEEEEQKSRLVEKNINPFSFDFAIQQNMLGCRKWVSPYDYDWLGKYR